VLLYDDSDKASLDDGYDGVLLYDDSDKASLDDGSDGSTPCPLEDGGNGVHIDMW